MTRRLIVCFFWAVTALAQTPQSATKEQAPASPSATPAPQATPPSLLKRDEKPADVAADQPVITVRGLCPAETKPATEKVVPSANQCAMTVTKAQFDNLLKAFNSNNQPISAAAKRKLAESYVEILIFAEAAKAAGVENSPTFAEVMRVLRLKTLADLYRTQIAEEYRNPAQQEIEAYYQANQQKFESVKLTRIYLPRSDPDPQATPEQKQDYQKKIQGVVDDIAARAGKGEAMDKLQKEAYSTLGIKSAPPNTDMSMARRGMFPPKLEQDIFSHKAGEVFRSDDGNGYIIYRVESRQTSPIESVHDEIVRDMLRQKLDEKTKELNAPIHTELDENYFGPPPPTNGPAMPPTPPK
ncbi:MAG TPA: peptidyl-prolyl cis-trans isomerase [Candidatus Angelobacter sp.]|jgi:hypothetical protein